jgi:hypothetical protein
MRLGVSHSLTLIWFVRPLAGWVLPGCMSVFRIQDSNVYA